GWEHFVGGGMATFDCNTDGFPDALLSGGAEASKLIINTTANRGEAISFKVSENSGAEFTGTTGSYPLDVDSDGTIDLIIMRVGENKLLRGLGNCLFEEANEKWGFDGRDSWTTAFSAVWENDAKWPTLAMGNYVDRHDPEGPFGTCDANALYHPQANGYTQPTILEPGYCALSILFSDWQRTGSPDLRISNDRHYYVHEGQEQMFSLTESRFLGPDDGWEKVKLWGMGIASQDINADGKPDVMLTSMGDQLLQFYERDGKFTDAPFALGTYSHRPYTGGDGRPSTGWHAEFGDVNNDGLPDLFIAKGNVDQMPGMAMKDPNNLLIQQSDGTFVEVGLEAGLADPERSRGAALIDFNLDGRLDIAVMNRRAPFEIYENRTESTGNFISIKLAQIGTNPDAVGAWVEMRTADKKTALAQEVTVGGGHASGENGPLHFGLAEQEQAEIRVIWPNGAISNWSLASANQLIEISPADNGDLKIEEAVNF
ncbi:MAG: CRTAC1 family protein, partial [Pseudomonadota bacterium]